MQHLRGRIAKSDVRTTRTYHVRTTYVPRTYVPRTYASSTVSRHFGAETKKKIITAVKSVSIFNFFHLVYDSIQQYRSIDGSQSSASHSFTFASRIWSRIYPEYTDFNYNIPFCLSSATQASKQSNSNTATSFSNPDFVFAARLLKYVHLVVCAVLYAHANWLANYWRINI